MGNRLPGFTKSKLMHILGISNPPLDIHPTKKISTRMFMEKLFIQEKKTLETTKMPSGRMNKLWHILTQQ